MKKIAYARVSTEQQSLNRQLDALQAYGYDEIFTEKMTGTKADRPELDKIKLVARDGDVVVIESLSRLGRSSKDLLNLLDEFERKGVQVVSLKENIDTRTPTGMLVTSVLAALVEYERSLIVQRTQEGLAASKARGGKTGGRPPVDKKAIERAVKLYRSKLYSVKEITAMCGVSQASLYRYLAKAA